jgi:hypothetical protein
MVDCILVKFLFIKFQDMCLQTISDTGKLVIVCLQQPSPRELSNFKTIQLLKTGGETVYFGPGGTGGELLIVNPLLHSCSKPALTKIPFSRCNCWLPSDKNSLDLMLY